MASLFMRAYRNTEDRPPTTLIDYFEEVFFTDPWADLDVSPSLVFEDGTSGIRGFIGCHPRRFRCGDRVVMAVAMGQMMVDPEMRRRGIAWNLGRAVIGGPQSLTFGTTASRVAADMWRKMGFWSPADSGLTLTAGIDPRGWIVPKRSESRSGLFGKSWLDGLIRFQHDVARRIAPPFLHPPITPADWVELHDLVCRACRLRPDLDVPHASWVWRMLSRSSAKGRCGTCVAVESQGQPVGWCVFFETDRQELSVVEWAHLPGQAGTLLACVAKRAAELNCRKIVARPGTPELLAEAANAGATLYCTAPAHVFHTDDPDVRSAILNGSVFVSELASEGWLCFADPRPPLDD